MGLDFVELVIASEEEFDISIENKDVENISTVGDYYSVILKKIEDIKKSECISNNIFYRLRREIIATLDLKRNDISPKVKIINIFGKKINKEYWEMLSLNSKLTLPKLTISNFSENMIIIFNILFGISIFINSFAFGFFGFGLSILIMILFNIISHNFLPRNYLPNQIKTISDLVNGMVATEYGKLEKNLSEISELNIWKKLVDLMVEQFGIEAEYITKNTTFLEDLKLE